MNKFTPSEFLELADVASAIESVCPVGYVRVKQAAEVVDDLYAALEVLANIPLEEFCKQGNPDQKLMGWNKHDLYVRDVLKARAALAKARGEE